ncbi:MAG: hypothetical protein K2G63_06615 [Oscillospiraceae bacterium]|nr:hypothetical protein [Oscillospiraceae bacterium]
MAFTYGFFNAKNLDRVYTAEDFTDYLSGLICNGILDTYGQCFSITSNNNLTVTIGTGKAWINGHYFINDTPYTIDLKSYMDESLKRYVTIGIVCDTSEAVRSCRIEIKSGTATASPIIPNFDNTETRTFLTLASIRLNGGDSVITSQDIFDYRENSSKCGYVKCILGKCKVSEMIAEITAIRQEISGLQSGTLTESVNELRQYLFNSADRIIFEKDDSGRLLYKNKDGSYMSGTVKISGVPYKFEDDGTLITGWTTVSGKYYYYDSEDGNIRTGWIEENGNMYYVTLLEGKLVSQHKTIDGKRYWFDSNGVATESKSKNFPDVDGDGSITSADASNILNFYSQSTGERKYTNDIDGWEKYLADLFAETELTTSDDYIYMAEKDGITLLYYKGDKNNIKIPDEIDGKPVKKIESTCFTDSDVTDVIIPDSVTEIY